MRLPIGLGGGGAARRWISVHACAFALPTVLLGPAQARGASPPVDRIVIEAAKPLRTVTPRQALGAALDGMESGDVDRYLTPANIAKMRSVGLRRVTYRLRPELAIEAWHWSEEGQWSDPGRQQGYWTSSDNPRRHPRVTWGYNLPRRGDSIDQAADNGYSRLDDGDPTTFWKSNPYLDREFTGAAQTRPQWIVVSFAAKKRIDAARIQWGAPFARHFLVQYWNRADPYDEAGRWVTFPYGDRTISSDPGDEILRLADALDRSHTRLIDAIEVQVKPKQVLIFVSASAEVELEEYGLRRKRQLFEDLFERSVHLVQDGREIAPRASSN